MCLYGLNCGIMLLAAAERAMTWSPECMSDFGARKLPQAYGAPSLRWRPRWWSRHRRRRRIPSSSSYRHLYDLYDVHDRYDRYERYNRYGRYDLYDLRMGGFTNVRVVILSVGIIHAMSR